MRALAFLCGASAFLAATSPFNAVTYLPFAARLAYWLALIGLWWATVRATEAALARKAASFGPIRRTLAGSLVSAPLVFITILLVQALIARSPPADALPQLLASVWLICLALGVVDALVRAARAPARPATALAEPGLDGPGLAARLPPALRAAPIYALSGEDHYVRVHTAQGQHLLLMRLGDAIAEMKGVEGAQVHRSWWVAKAGAAALRRDGRRLQIELKSGQRAPVSRAGAKTMSTLGW